MFRVRSRAVQCARSLARRDVGSNVIVVVREFADRGGQQSSSTSSTAWTAQHAASAAASTADSATATGAAAAPAAERTAVPGNAWEPSAIESTKYGMRREMGEDAVRARGTPRSEDGYLLQAQHVSLVSFDFILPPYPLLYG